MSDIKLTIDGTEYELLPSYPNAGNGNFDYGAPVVWMNGNQFVSKEIKKEKDIPKHDYYELFSYGEGVNSVKRHSDGEIYSVGGYAEVKYNDGSMVKFIIRKFELEPNGELMVCLVNSSARYNLSLLEPKVKPTVPLFTTEDGVEIFEPDHYFLVNKDFKHSGESNGLAWYNPQSGEKYFSTVAKAKEYILRNKKVELSMNDILEHFGFEPRYSGKYESLSEFFKSKINV